ncbi:MAG: acyltransferase family protein [Promethearchaeota archaeon]
MKILFTFLVIFVHVRVTYGGEGSWYYIATLNKSNSVDVISITILYTLTGVMGLFLAATMGLFFLMSAYFTPKSYDRKGVSSFWKERILRIGIPILLYILIVNPVIAYIMAAGGIQPYASYSRMQGSFIEYYLSNFQSIENFVDFITNFSITWFLIVLLIFTAVYTIWRQITKIDSIQQKILKELRIPKYIYLLFLALGLGFLTFLIRLVVPVEQFPFGLPLAYMIQYFMMFIVGIIAYRYDWFEQMRRHHVKAWGITIFIAVILFFTYFFVFVGVESDYSLFFGGPHLQALVYAIVESINCMGIIFVLIKIFYAKFNQ